MKAMFISEDCDERGTIIEAARSAVLHCECCSALFGSAPCSIEIQRPRKTGILLPALQ